jgi:uncharacterized protein
LIYLDSCILIYVIEGEARFQGMAQAALASASALDFAISPVVKAECLIGPFRAGDAAREALFTGLFLRCRTLPIDEATFLTAARLRADHGLKLPDALHVACARQHGCAELWTNDDRLAGAAGPMARALFP